MRPNFVFTQSLHLSLSSVFRQVMLVGFPALYLVDPENMLATYFLQTGLIFVLSMSMLCLIYGPCA
jgi:hypothetical protein